MYNKTIYSGVNVNNNDNIMFINVNLVLKLKIGNHFTWCVWSNVN